MIVRTVFIVLILGSTFLHAAENETNPPSAAVNETVVTIRVVSKDTPGPLLVYLYNTKDSWLKAEEAYRKTVFKNQAKSEYRWILKDLPPAEYAVQVIQDEDNNGTLSMGLFGPSEGVGVSNYVPTFIPRFEKAKFRHLGQKTLVSVEMND